MTGPTHYCHQCQRHFTRHEVRQVHPAEHTPEGEAEILVCPICNSYDIEPLVELMQQEKQGEKQEVTHVE